jgi:hypothetical protein
MEKTRKLFMEGSFLYPPMDILYAQPHPQSAEHLLKRCERLAGDGPGKVRFYQWLARMMESSAGSFSFAFYGTSLYGSVDLPAHDVDTLLFIYDQSTKAPPNPPSFIHSHSIYENKYCPGNEPAKWKFLVSHTLLIFPESKSDLAIEKILEGRKEILDSPFLAGGIGDLVTFAAFKALNNQEHRLFEPHEFSRFRGRRFSIEWNRYELTSMLSRSIYLEELHGQVREQMRLMDDADLSALTKAALRRLRVKRENRPELTKRFVEGIRRL